MLLFWRLTAPSVYQTLVVYVEDEDDIVKCIKFVEKHNLDVAVAGGRHSYHGASSSTGMVIGSAPFHELDGMRHLLN